MTLISDGIPTEWGARGGQGGGKVPSPLNVDLGPPTSARAVAEGDRRTRRGGRGARVGPPPTQRRVSHPTALPPRPNTTPSPPPRRPKCTPPARRQPLAVSLLGGAVATDVGARYTLTDEVLGSGAFATVRVCVERATGRRRAVKSVVKARVQGLSRDWADVRREVQVRAQPRTSFVCACMYLPVHAFFARLPPPPRCRLAALLVLFLTAPSVCTPPCCLHFDPSNKQTTKTGHAPPRRPPKRRRAARRL